MNKLEVLLTLTIDMFALGKFLVVKQLRYDIVLYDIIW